MVLEKLWTDDEISALREMCAQGKSPEEISLHLDRSIDDLLTGLKIAMEQNRIAIPYDRLLCQQINEQQYEYSKSGHLQFNHPAHCHDDMLWALALATAGIKRTPPPGSGAVMGH